MHTDSDCDRRPESEERQEMIEKPMTFEEWCEAVDARLGHVITMSDIQLDRLRQWFEHGYAPQTAAHWLEEAK